MIRDLIDEWLWDRRFARLEREADRLRRNRIRPPAVIWKNGTWGIWSFATDKRLAEIEEEQAVMLGFAPVGAVPANTTIH